MNNSGRRSLQSLLPAPALYSVRNIKARLEENAYNSGIYITVNSLEYLKKSGHVTPAGATLANVINLKPVLTIQGERLDSYAKVRGMKQAEKKMIEAIQNSDYSH